MRLDAARPSGASATNARTVIPLVHETDNEDNGEVSPDGHWLAYQSDQGGLNQIHLRPFPNTDSGHWQVSTAGGSKPLWSRDGKELFYLDGSNALTAVQVETTPSPRFGNPTKLFDGRYFNGGNGRTYDVSPNGKRFLMIKDSRLGDQVTTPASMVVVLNWPEELKARVPAK